MSQHSSRGGQSGNRDHKGNRSRGGRRRSGGERNRSNGEGRDGEQYNRGPRNNQNQKSNTFQPSRGKPAPKPTFFERLLSILTFGLLGKKAAPAPQQRREDRPERREREDRGERGERGDRADRGPRPDRPAREDRAPRAEEPARAPREPRKVEVTGPRLYVGNLDYEATEGDLEELFRGVGAVISAEIVTNQRNQQSKGFGFVEMSHIEEARRAVEVLHDKDFMGRKLLVTGAKSTGPNSESEDETQEEAPQEETAAAS